ncbi:ABC transporter ATP-binding protein [Roseiarcaceae bacterium H3SJ34-1]|nr:ABC transporter ATP-binding protein [Roseiarcaceae bacterium H3SJ34-1]
MVDVQVTEGGPLLSLRGIVKRFGDFVANDHIDLDIHEGEAHALIGENGAGKSTLVKIIYGLLQPTEGTIAIAGEQVRLSGPEDARTRGIGMVFQHFSLFDNLTVAENIALVLPRDQNLNGLRGRIAEVAERYRMPLEPDREVWSLSAGERQRIEIARCLLQNPRLVILDEPTSVLTPQESYRLFETLDRLKSEGRSLLYISHKLDEVKRLCERATILRLGKKVGYCDPRKESARSLAALMVGTQISDIHAPTARAAGPQRLVVDDLSIEAEEIHGVDLEHISLAVRAGEVFGIAGVAGNGQSELFAVLSGERIGTRAEAIRIDGAETGGDDITRRRLLGAAFVPEERNGHAAAPDFSLTENVVLSRHATAGVAQHGLVSFDRAKALAQSIISVFDVRKAGPDPAARTLSGGNLQKFVVGREILSEPKILVVNQPTWGVDAAACAAIRQALVDLAARGAAVLLISQDLDELFEICDRIAVIHDGRLSEALDARGATREEIGLLMTGTGHQTAAAHAH